MARKRFINELETGDSVRSHFAVVKRSLRQFRNKEGHFLALVLSDKSGSVQANLWDNAPDVAATFEEGDIVCVTGRVEQYQGKNQLVIDSLEWASPSDVDLTDFLPQSQVDPQVLQAQFDEAIASLGGEPLRELLQSFFSDEELMRRILEAPAAKGLHHARLGGLGEHVGSALRIAEIVCDTHAELDRDLVIAGVLLHDLGKLWELEYGATINYSVAGRLLGHISIGFAEVDRRARAIPDFPESLRLQILHIILSHHGEAEFGSPIRPMTAEAMAVHSIESCDAKVTQFVEKISEAVEAGRTFTDYDPLLQRYLYAGGASPAREPSPPANDKGQTELF